MKQKKKPDFINREEGFIEFNKRVLERARDKNIPLNERLKFLAITESNLDEFLSVRFSGVYNGSIEADYSRILKLIKKFKNNQQNVLSMLINKLNTDKIKLSKISSADKKERDYLYSLYTNNIFPLLTPFSAGINEAPKVQSGQLCIGVTISSKDSNEDIVIIPVDKNIPLTYVYNNKLYLTEDIILQFMGDTLFINREISSYVIFRLVKDFSMIMSHDKNMFIVDRMNETLLERTNASPIFMDIASGADEKYDYILSGIFDVPERHIYHSKRIINLKRFMSNISNDSYNNFEPFEFINGEKYYDIFEALRNEDILLHHPYDSYDTVINFINHAANDENVIAIKQTLYRVSGLDSPIVEGLCLAAKHGKQVTVLVEIKARFDESNNIALIKKLSNSGANVVYGFEELKTHCKMCLVIRKEGDNLKVYSHLATGNYNEKTSKIYTDLSYLTSKRKIGQDLINIFNIISGNSEPEKKLNKIFYAPVSLRKQLVKCIDREIVNAKKGKPAHIFIKINSMSDKDMCKKLYEAADKGVNIYIICRGACSILPRKNIFIKSIVGRFLEHSRIYYFENNKNPEYYISSADLLTRNLDKRVETLISLKDSNVIETLKWIIEVFKKDEKNSFDMKPDGSWEQEKGDFSSHDWFIRFSDIKKKKKSWKGGGKKAK